MQRPANLTVADLSPAQYDLLCNGAGPMHLGWLIPDLWFKAAADQHDLAYWAGGRLTDKIRADLIFWANAILAISNIRPASHLVWAWVPALVLAHMYFLAVAFPFPSWICWRWRRQPYGRPELAALQRFLDLLARPASNGDIPAKLRIEQDWRWCDRCKRRSLQKRVAGDTVWLCHWCHGEKEEKG